MKQLGSAIKAHIENEVTSLCRCWVLETVRGEKLGFTDHDEDILIEDILCEKNAGFEASGIEERTGLNVNTSEVAGALQSQYVSVEDINQGKYDNARISTYIVNWQDVSQYFLDQVSLVGEVHQEDGHYRMELRSLSSQLEQTKGNHFIRRCQADLGDKRCRVSLLSPGFTVAGQVEEVLSQLIIRVSGLAEFDNNWFRSGYLTWKTGQNFDRRIEITEHIKSDESVVLHLWQPMPNEIVNTDNFSVQVGCDKSFKTCKLKFDNTINFRGFPHIPGNKFALSYANNSDNFDGGPIIL